MDNAESYLKYVVNHILHHCSTDVAFFESYLDNTIQIRLKKLIKEPFVRISYRDAIDLLRIEIERDRSKWEFPDVGFGIYLLIYLSIY
jgi:asparaginyl-tRNA synthetase